MWNRRTFTGAAGRRRAAAIGSAVILTAGSRVTCSNYTHRARGTVEEPDLNLTGISQDDGDSFLCLNDACTEEDRQRLGYFAGGGIGG